MTNLNEPIRGKVARVLNSRDIALNKGEQDGVKMGMIFRVLSPKGTSVKDPDTGVILGSVDLEKVRVKITAVQDRVSVASTYRTHKINVGGTGYDLFGLSMGSTLFTPPKWETRIETLKSSESSMEELDEEDTYVKTGDPVVQHIETDSAEEIE